MSGLLSAIKGLDRPRGLGMAWQNVPAVFELGGRQKGLFWGAPSNWVRHSKTAPRGAPDGSK